MSYSSRHVQALFRISGETVRTWADEFNDYLSPAATPGKGKHRLFSNDDMRVFAYIADRKEDGATFEDIHLGLRSGERGDEPVLQASEMEAIVSGEIEKRLSTQVDHLYNTIERMRRERDEALALAQTAQEYRDKSIQMESELKLTKQRAEELDRQLKESQKRVEELSREVGEAYVKGIMEALERKGDLPRRDQNNNP